MKIFLKMKSSQLFILLTVPMLLFQLSMVVSQSFKWIRFLNAVGILVLIGWLFAIGYTSNKRLPAQLKKSPLLFQLGFTFAAVYMITFFGFIMPDWPPANPVVQFPFWIIPLHFTAMAAMFYGLWFTSKQFETLRQGRELKFIDFSGPFFLFCFFPIGVWFIQPRINDLLGKNNT